MYKESRSVCIVDKKRHLNASMTFHLYAFAYKPWLVTNHCVSSSTAYFCALFLFSSTLCLCDFLSCLYVDYSELFCLLFCSAIFVYVQKRIHKVSISLNLNILKRDLALAVTFVVRFSDITFW